MKRYGLACLVLLSISATANASEYSRLLQKSELMEGALRPKQMVALADATTGHMKEVMSVCDERVGPMHGGLGVIFKINEDGQVTQTWTRGDTEYERCFASAMQERIEFDPPMAPFFTAMDFGRAKSQ